jgi:hypothetical protein
MYKLTTPHIAIEVDKDLTDADDVELTISDTVNHFLYFHKPDLTITPSIVSVTLTQEQTNQLWSGIIFMQLRYLKNGLVPEPSNLIETTLKSVLSQEVLS